MYIGIEDRVYARSYVRKSDEQNKRAITINLNAKNILHNEKQNIEPTAMLLLTIRTIEIWPRIPYWLRALILYYLKIWYEYKTNNKRENVFSTTKW